MNWSDVGDWLKKNAGPGAALVGSLLTGNMPGAVAAGVAMVTTATGSATPDDVLVQFQQDPSTVIKLKELALQDAANIRAHIQTMEEMRLKDEQHQHEQTQLTIRNADNAEDRFVRWTRPAQSWVSLLAALAYIFMREDPEMEIALVLLALPWAYAGLRQIGSAVDALRGRKGNK